MFATKLQIAPKRVVDYLGGYCGQPRIWASPTYEAPITDDGEVTPIETDDTETPTEGD